MGNNSGSYTAKATICPQLYPFTKWGKEEIKDFLIRGQKELPETFGLRRYEFELVVGEDTMPTDQARSLFNDIFDTDKNGLVDKFEAMCVIAMTSKISSKEKIYFFFDLFNFNDKGYLNESELTLLFMAVTRGASKVDKKFMPPSSKHVKNLVDEALEFGKVEYNTLRKPELVRFVVNNPSVTAYLECWRGHASQVLVAELTKWKDLAFPCNESAIYPSTAWLSIGLPPEGFVHWRRRERVGTELGCEQLFTHTTSFLKTIDRRKVFKGEGVLGIGHLKQGLLADRWFLNALATMISKPETIFYNFATTGQEDQGRFCLRFYEGGRWRSVYVDDRIPCSPTNHALFATSSCGYEAWPMIIEKALAKYLGSYGHVGAASARPDATQFALRLLTGGHVLQYAVKDFDWKSMNEDVRGENGAQLIFDCLREGSLVSFGRSSPLAMMTTKTLPNMPAYVLPPLSRLFPVLSNTYLKGYNYFILRDSWGLIGDVEKAVNFESGHVNTFKLRVEDIPLYYDTIVISKFPDSLRTTGKHEKVSLLLANKPPPITWKTEVLSNFTKGKDKPAIFLLKLKKMAKKKDFDQGQKKKKKKSILVSKSTDPDVGEDADDINYRLKDPHDFSRESSRGPTMSNALGKKSQSEQEESDTKHATKTPLLSNWKVERKNELVDICLTVSSACDWTYAGSNEAAAKLRMRLVPTEETIEIIKKREKDMKEQEMQEKQQIEARKRTQALLLAGDNVDPNNMAESVAASEEKKEEAQPATASKDGHSVGSEERSHQTGSVVDASKEAGKNLEEESEQLPAYEGSSANLANRDFSRYFDISFAGERSWMAQCLQLIPGDYYLIVDISFSIPYLDARKRCLPRDISDAPWVESALADIVTKQQSSMNYIPKYADALDDDSVTSDTSIQKLERKLFAKEHEVKSCDSIQTLSKNVADGDTLEHRIWVEASSLDELQLSTVELHKDIVPILPSVSTYLSTLEESNNASEGKDGFESKQDADHDASTVFSADTSVVNIEEARYFHSPMLDHKVLFPSPILPEKVAKEKWPFLAETQGEVGSRELVTVMASLRDEVESLGAEFVSMAVKYKEERKRIVKLQKQAKAAAL